MAWLMTEARVLASIDVANSHSAKAKGLLGRDDIDGAYAIYTNKLLLLRVIRFQRSCLAVVFIDPFFDDFFIPVIGPAGIFSPIQQPADQFLFRNFQRQHHRD